MCFWGKSQTRIEMRAFSWCEGYRCHLDLSGQNPSSLYRQHLHPVEGGQHDSVGLPVGGKGSQGTLFPLGSSEYAAPLSLLSHAPIAGLLSVGGDPPGRCGVALPAGAGLAPGFQRRQSDGVPVGDTPDRPLRFASVGAVSPIYVMASGGRARGCRRSQHGLGFIVWSSSSHPSPPFEGGGKLEVSGGVLLLVTPHWEAQMWFASLQALPVLEVRCLPFHESLVVGLVTGVPPPSLGRLFPVV